MEQKKQVKKLKAATLLLVIIAGTWVMVTAYYTLFPCYMEIPHPGSDWRLAPVIITDYEFCTTEELEFGSDYYLDGSACTVKFTGLLSPPRWYVFTVYSGDDIIQSNDHRVDNIIPIAFVTFKVDANNEYALYLDDDWQIFCFSFIEVTGGD